MKAAIIGCGAISMIHAESLKNQGFEIVALCDIVKENAENINEKYGLNSTIYTDYRKMLNMENIDAVHICTPHYLHAQMAEYALKKNINVLLEKPACINEKEIEMLISAQEKSKAQLGICFQNRYLEGNKVAKEFLKDKTIFGIIGTLLWSRDEDYYSISEWRGSKQKEGGGVLINQAIHTLDLMLWLTSMPKYVTATVSNRHLQGIIEVEDTAECFWEIENGNAMLYATTAASKNYPINIKIDSGAHTVEITGESCEIDGNKFSDSCVSMVGKKYWGIGHYKLIKDFYCCLKEGRKFSIDIEEGAKALKLIFAIYKFAGKRIKI